jgi:hypothetical protein
VCITTAQRAFGVQIRAHGSGGRRTLGGRGKLTHFGNAKTLHLQVEGKNKTMTGEPAEKIKLANYLFRDEF